MFPLVEPTTYLGPWVWAFVPIVVVVLLYCGSILYLGSDKFSKPSTDRLRREEAERQARVEAGSGETAAELV